VTAAGGGAMLEVRDVDAYRGAAHVLRKVSLRLGPAETVCVVGRNGAGKTTTMESIMGLLPVESGSVSLAGRDVSRLPAHQRVREGMGFAPEDAGVFPELTVSENLFVSRWVRGRWRKSGGTSPSAAGDADARIAAVFPEIQAFLERKGQNLSGGQKKMVSIARAMVLAPVVLLLDEPFEGLAPIVVDRFIEAVNAIKSMGISLLIAASNLTTAMRVADRIYVIDRGEILYAGAAASVCDDQEVMRTIRG
jgi:branched-chain amino acid transport system ATP-binding protein